VKNLNFDLCALVSIASVAVCLAVALCSTEALRLPIKPPPFLQNQVDQWKDDAQDVKDHIEEELQNIKDKWEDLLNGIGGIGGGTVETEAPQEETTAAPEEATTLAPVETTAAPVETTAAPVATTTPVIYIIIDYFLFRSNC